MHLKPEVTQLLYNAYCDFTYSKPTITDLNSCVVLKEEEDHTLVYDV